MRQFDIGIDEKTDIGEMGLPIPFVQLFLDLDVIARENQITCFNLDDDFHKSILSYYLDANNVKISIGGYDKDEKV